MASVSPRQIFCLLQEPPPLSELHVASKLARQSYSAAVDTLSSLPKPQVLEAQAKLWAGNGTQLTLLSMKCHLHSKLQTHISATFFQFTMSQTAVMAPLPPCLPKVVFGCGGEGCVPLMCSPFWLTDSLSTQKPKAEKDRNNGVTTGLLD